jgi:hypothetical protein
MEDINWLTVFGLMSDIFGFILLYFFGLSSSIWQTREQRLKQEAEFEKEQQEWEERNPDEPSFLRCQSNKKSLSTIGFILVLIGFVLQIMASFGLGKSPGIPNKNHECASCQKSSNK